VTGNICDNNVLRGYKATKALDKYIRTLEKGKIDGLTEKQLNILIKTAQVLRTAVVATQQSLRKTCALSTNKKVNDNGKQVEL
jgi:hypothetical protein